MDCKEQTNCKMYIDELVNLKYSFEYIESKAYQSYGSKVGLDFINKTINNYKVVDKLN